jgi:hypothetical protein
MATEVEVDVNINNNIEPTIANLKRLKRQLKDTAAGSDEFNRLSAQIRDLDDSIKDASATSDDFLGYLENADGPLGLFGKGIRNAEKTFSSFNGVLKASVIGLIVGLIGGLVAAFNDNEKAIKKLQPLFEGLEKIFNGIFSIVEPLFNTLVDLAVSALPLVSDAFGVVYSSVFAVVQSLGSLGSAVVKFIKGDFSGAWQDAKASVTDFGKNYEASVERFNKGSKELTKKEKEESEKRRLARIEANKKQEEDFKKSIEETQKILDKRQQEDEKEYSERLSKVTTINARHLEKLQESQKNVTKVLFKSLTDNIDREIALEKKKSDELINIAQTEAQTKANIQQAYINNAIRLGQGLRQIAGQNKELAIAGIILEQSAAITSIAMNAKKNFVANGGFKSPLAYIGLAADIAAGLAAAKAGAKGIQDIRSGTASGSSMSFGNQQMTPSYSTSPQFNVIGTSGVNQIAQLVGQNQQPIKAYVVGSEISSQQSLDRNKVMTASLG